MKDFEHKYPLSDVKRVLILGKGVSARATFDYLKKSENGARLKIDMVEEDELDAANSYDICVASPGISEFSNFYKRAKSVSKEVISEVEFAYRESEKNSLWIAITGTNGKTTTTALTEAILKACGALAVAVGNIGQTCIGQVDGEGKVYVCECSSYQLASTSKFCPDACAILNITPDHLKWHESFENYEAAKAKIFANSKDREDALVYLDHSLANLVAGDSYSCKVETDLTSLERITVESLKDKMQIKGEHNVQNAICATTLARFVLENKKVPGIEKMKKVPGMISEALLEFSQLEHRIEPCGEVGGVLFYNDSKATNVDSTIKALSAFSEGNVILLLGGKDKGSSLKPLADEIIAPVSNDAQPRVKCAICFGEAKERFLRELASIKEAGVSLKKAYRLSDAFELAMHIAAPRDVVLLSPACASFDEFSCFEERGEVFKDLVENFKHV